MIKGIFTAGRSLYSRFKNIEVIGNNLANVTSTGFKKSVTFSEIINSVGETRMREATNFRDGSYVETKNTLDLALRGDAFFSIEGMEGVEYTRNGRFSISDEGFLVNEKGARVLGKDGPINLNSYMLNENQSLTVMKNGDLQFGNSVIGALRITGFDRGGEIIRRDGTTFSSVSSDVHPDYEVLQGYLEESNVNPIEEMTAMIKVHSEYDSASKMINYLDESLQKAIEIGKI